MKFLKNTFSRLLLVYILWLASWTLVTSLYNVYLYGMGIPIEQIFFSNAFVYAAALLTIPLFSKFETRDFMVVGVAMSILSVLSLLLFPPPWAAYVSQFFAGTTCFIFWVPFNTLYYEFRKGDNAQLAALYYSLGPLLAMILPVFCGWFVVSMGFPLLFALAILLFIVTFAVTFLLIDNRPYHYGFIRSLKAISGLKSIIFMEGFAGAVIIQATLGALLLLYTSKPLEFGIFTSLATVFSVIAAITAARISDKLRRRRELLLIMVTCFAFSAIAASLAQDIMVFFVTFGLINFFSRIFFPLPLALVVDNSKDLQASMVGREIMLNTGRLAGVMAGCLALLFVDLKAVLFLQGLALFLYIPVFENRKKKLVRH